MTPNQPSGMTPKNPESHQGLFGRIWARWQRIQRPVPAAPYSPALVDPFLATEAVSEADRPSAVAQATRTRQLMDRICALNNANVTRDYGTRTEDLTHVGMVPPDLSHDDFADAKRLLGVRVVAP